MFSVTELAQEDRGQGVQIRNEKEKHKQNNKNIIVLESWHRFLPSAQGLAVVGSAAMARRIMEAEGRGCDGVEVMPGCAVSRTVSPDSSRLRYRRVHCMLFLFFCVSTRLCWRYILGVCPLQSILPRASCMLPPLLPFLCMYLCRLLPHRHGEPPIPAAAATTQRGRLHFLDTCLLVA